MLCLLPSLSQRITYVEFNNIKFHDFAEMIQYSCAFPLLETLNLSSTWGNANEPRNDLRLPQKLHTLNIQYGLLALLPWLAEKMPTCLSTLRLFRLSPKHIPHLESVLHASANSLKKLELGLHAFMEADEFIGKIDFRNNGKLQLLVLHNAPLILFRSVLQSAMEHTELQEAHLITGYDERIPPAQHAIWVALDQHIADSSLNQHLTKLVFRLDVSSDDFRDRIIKEIETCLPSSTALGIVRCVSEKDRVVKLRSKMTGPISSRTWGDLLVDKSFL
ncbi:hypothetical protein H0H92_008985 [Tricholoma furcatifolium]|nr:hypothetical protein H0H92_008985 [Tricholoma furcatifolium]